jgi:hypothetical protein
MKIKSVETNNRKKSIEIDTSKGRLALPFSRLELKPTPKNGIAEIYVDKELASSAVTYVLASGDEASVHLDAFLDYNKDPDFLRNAALHQLTVEAIKLMKKSSLSNQEVIRRLKTSPSQLYRLLDPANYTKSIDEMLRLVSVLGYRVEWNIVEDAA